MHELWNLNNQKRKWFYKFLFAINFKKILDKIPVILIGETCVGKTKILKILSNIYDRGNLNWRKLEIPTWITEEDIF